MGNGSTAGGDDAATLVELSARVATLEQQLGSLSREIDRTQRLLQESRQPAVTPEPQPLKPRQQDDEVLRVLNRELRRREFENGLQTARAKACGLAGRFSLPDSTRPSLDEFGDNVVLRVQAIADQCGHMSREAVLGDSPEHDTWVQAWRDLHEWAQSVLAGIDAKQSKDMWEWYAEAVYDLEGLLIPE
jgi:hypothetical protein